ncbi:MAG: ATP-binding protein [Prolixibacteraceae bacterium]
MSLSVAPFIVSVAFSGRMRKHAAANKLSHLEKVFKNALIFSVVLLATEMIFHEQDVTKWIWHLFLLGILVFSIRHKELRASRMFAFAFLPFLLISLLNDLTELISPDIFKEYESYFKNCIGLSIIWLVATLWSQNRQFKAAEKERIKREHEDELNRAIAARKVELEVLVSERTAELTQQKEELEHTLEELRTMQSQLIQSEKMASLGELTAGIAHEIQNPLNFVNNFSEINLELIGEMEVEIEKGNLDEAKKIASDIQENLLKINQHGNRADGIVKAMLQHSRSSSGVKELVDINKLADEFLRLAYHGLRAKDKSFNAGLKADFDSTLGKINVVSEEVGRVVLNLVNNAFYAVNERKKKKLEGYEPFVSIRTKSVGSHVEICVSDNGNGIPQKVLEKIFQPFFTTKPTGQGTGLGLSLSYDIIKAHGGDIKVQTKEGEGTEFTIVLPQ